MNASFFTEDVYRKLLDSEAEEDEPAEQEEKDKTETKKQEAEPIVLHFNTLLGLLRVR